MAEKKRKYLLFNKSDERPNSDKPCAFFITPEGCRNAANCMFSHGDIPTKGTINAAKAREASKDKYVAPRPVEEVHVEKSVEKRRKKHEDTAAVVVSAPAPAPAAVPSYDFQKQLEAQRLEFERQIREQQEAFRQAQENLQKQLVQKNSNIAPAPVAAVKPPTPKREERSSKKRKSDEGLSASVAHVAAASRPIAPTLAAPVAPRLVAPAAVAANSYIHNLPVSAPVLPVPRAPAPVLASTATPNNNKKTPKKAKTPNEEDDDTQFLFGAVNTALVEGQSMTTVAKSAPPPPGLPAPIYRNNGASASASVAAAVAVDNSKRRDPSNPFVENESVSRLLSTSGTEHATLGPAAIRKIQAQAAGGADAKAAAAAAAAVPEMSLDAVNTHLAKSAADLKPLDWATLTARTVAHPRYAVDYTFTPDHSWVHAAPYDDWIRADPKRSNYPTVIAIDCEMCETTDPVTGSRDSSVLIRFSAVNGVNPAEVLLDSLVTPTMPVSDWRSNIHGITEENVRGVLFTLRHAQAFLLNICSDRTVILGHAVHHDLKALHFQHRNVIDTAYFFTVANEPGSMASVRDISEQVLGVKLPDIHDSVQDARAALQSAAYFARNGTAPEIVRKQRGASGSSLPVLLIHRIPDFCTEESVRQMIIQHTNVLPTSIAVITRGAPEPMSPSGGNANATGKTTITFSTQQHADLAFESISGPNRPDKSNRPQKRVYLRGGGYVCVRKN